MDKAGALIERLLEQYRNNAGKEELAITAQLLLNELENVKEEVKNFQNNVSVYFPSAVHVEIADTATQGAVSANTPQQNNKVTVQQPRAIAAPAIEQKHVNTVSKQAEDTGKDFFDPMVEIPTLALKQQEVNETISSQQESVNDKLKNLSAHKEVGNKIKEGPIKDLRRAIGINDQYLFINELFRGDQTMYERSIKTINGFNIYAEAELWIKRELKLKLGWNESSDVVQLFDQLIKRRFA
jgi:hypothetical protein